MSKLPAHWQRRGENFSADNRRAADSWQITALNDFGDGIQEGWGAFYWVKASGGAGAFDPRGTYTFESGTSEHGGSARAPTASPTADIVIS